MKILLLSVVAASLALASIPASAQTPPSPPSPPAAPQGEPHMMMKLKMKGPMTKAQHREHGQKMFKKLDANGDGNVTQAEFQAHHDTMFDKMDDNKDGTISPEERRDKMRMMHREHKGAKDAADKQD